MYLIDKTQKCAKNEARIEIVKKKKKSVSKLRCVVPYSNFEPLRVTIS